MNKIRDWIRIIWFDGWYVFVRSNPGGVTGWVREVERSEEQALREGLQKPEGQKSWTSGLCKTWVFMVGGVGGEVGEWEVRF